jgi:hypothetical protein
LLGYDISARGITLHIKRPVPLENCPDREI